MQARCEQLSVAGTAQRQTGSVADTAHRQTGSVADTVGEHTAKQLWLWQKGCHTPQIYVWIHASCILVFMFTSIIFTHCREDEGLSEFQPKIMRRRAKSEAKAILFAWYVVALVSKGNTQNIIEFGSMLMSQIFEEPSKTDVQNTTKDGHDQ